MKNNCFVSSQHSAKSRITLFFVLLFFVCMSFSCTGKSVSSPKTEATFQDGQLFLADGRPISMKAFAKRASEADYILIGETHDAPHHHLMQARLLEAVAKGGVKPAVGFEMLYSRNQNLLESFNEGKIKVKDLEEASGWQQSWSYPFAIYAPIFKVAEDFDLPVYGLNISKATLDKVKAMGFEQARDSLPNAERPDLPDEVIWPMEEQVTYLEKMREGFDKWQKGSGIMGGGTSEQKKSASGSASPSSPMAGNPRRFMLVQSLWDTSMAESAIKAHEETDRPVVIIAGSGHVEHGYGIAHRINTLRPGSRILLVLPLSHPFAEEDRRMASADVFYASRPGILSLGLVFKAEADVIIVDEVSEGSRAEAARLKVGDRILRLEGKDLDSPGDFHSAIAIADLMDKRSGIDGKSEKALFVERNGELKNLVLH